MPILRVATHMDMTDRGSMEDGIAQLEELEEERLGPDEEIQQSDLRLQALMNERARLREKSAMAEAEVQKLGEEIKREFLDKKPMVIKQDERNYVDKLGDYRQKFISLMHWMRPYVIKEITDGGAVQLMKLNGELFPGKVTDSEVKWRTLPI